VKAYSAHLILQAEVATFYQATRTIVAMIVWNALLSWSSSPEITTMHLKLSKSCTKYCWYLFPDTAYS